jgi:hypothetical protein
MVVEARGQGGGGVDSMAEEVVRVAVVCTRWQRRRSREEDFGRWWQSLRRTPVRWRRPGGRGANGVDLAAAVTTGRTGRRRRSGGWGSGGVDPMAVDVVGEVEHGLDDVEEGA